MVKDFSYFQLTKIVFGPGHVRNIPSLMEEYENKKLLVVTDKNISSFKFFTETVDSLTSNGFKCVVFDEVEPNPSIETCDKAAALARNGCSAVLSIGGGSVIDTGKSAATLVTNPGSIKDYLLGYEDAPRPIINKPIPHIAVPTTSGTGSEVSRTIVITDNKTHAKNMRFSTEFFPVCTVVDPELTLELPARITASTGMDVLCHAMETYLSTVNNAYTNILSLEAMRKVFRNLPKCVNAPDLDCRSEMALASTFGGLCLNGGPCLIPHCTAGLLAMKYDLPHGLSCALLLPSLIDYVKREAAEKCKAIMDYVFPEEHCMEKYAGEALIGKVNILMKDIGMQNYIDAPVPDKEFIDTVVNKAMACGGMSVCPRKVEPESVREMVLSLFKQNS